MEYTVTLWRFGNGTRKKKMWEGSTKQPNTMMALAWAYRQLEKTNPETVSNVIGVSVFSLQSQVGVKEARRKNG